MKKSFVSLLTVFLAIVFIFAGNIVVVAKTENNTPTFTAEDKNPSDLVMSGTGNCIRPTGTTQDGNTMRGKTYIVNTGNHKNLIVKEHDLISQSHELIRTIDCVFNEDNVCEVNISYESDFNIYIGSKLVYTSYFNNIKNKYISTKTFTVFNTLEEALNDDGEPVIIETEPSETEPSENKTKITLKKSKATLYLKGTTQIKATVKNAKGKTTYKSSNTKIAKVNSNGKVTAKKAGKAKITVKNNGVKKYFKITVKKPKLNTTKKNLKVKKSFRLRITGKVGKATFISSNKKIASVNSKGKIVAKKKGSAVIKVKTNGIVLKCKVQVK